MYSINEAAGQEGGWHCDQASSDEAGEAPGQPVGKPRIRIVVAGCCGCTHDGAYRRAARDGNVEISQFVVVANFRNACARHFILPSAGPWR